MLFRIFTLWLALVSFTIAEELPPVSVIEVSNLQQDGLLAAEKNLPILLMFSIEDCGYCEYVREEHLKPMLRNADYMKQIIIREIHTDVTDSVIDFNGREISSSKLASRYKAHLNPTVVFLGPQGKELSKRLVGVTSVDYYGGYMDAAIEESNQRLRRDVSMLK